ncbi:MAG: TonB-dependent receptor plug domain-containing protein, partial [Myxococcaceae bacterium]
KFGGVVALPAGFSVRANAGQANRAPSFLELYVAQGTLIPNPNLRPERALFADAALSHKTAFTSASVGGFYSLYEDLISYELYPPMLAKPFNFRTARVYGLEAEGDVRPRSWLSASAGYTLMFSQNLRDDARFYLKELPYRPRHKLSARVSGGPRIFRGTVEVLAQSEQFLNRTDTLTLPARAFVNAGVSSVVHQSPEVTVSGELKNVFDQQAADLDGYPLPGRAAYVTLSVAMDGRESGKGQQQ